MSKHTPGLSVKSPIPARFPAYRIVNEDGETLASVPISASGGSHRLSVMMAASPDMLAALRRSAEGWANAIELGLIPSQHVMTATILRDAALTAIAKAEGGAA